MTSSTVTALPPPGTCGPPRRASVGIPRQKPRRITCAENADERNPERPRDVHWPGVASHEQGGACDQRGEFVDRPPDECSGRHSGERHRPADHGALGRAARPDDAETAPAEPARDLGEPVDRPAPCALACGRMQQRKRRVRDSLGSKKPFDAPLRRFAQNQLQLPSVRDSRSEGSEDPDPPVGDVAVRGYFDGSRKPKADGVDHGRIEKARREAAVDQVSRSRASAAENRNPRVPEAGAHRQDKVIPHPADSQERLRIGDQPHPMKRHHAVDIRAGRNKRREPVEHENIDLRFGPEAPRLAKAGGEAHHVTKERYLGEKHAAAPRIRCPSLPKIRDQAEAAVARVLRHGGECPLQDAPRAPPPRSVYPNTAMRRALARRNSIRPPLPAVKRRKDIA